jgi:CRP-like cAMP-binding protein
MAKQLSKTVSNGRARKSKAKNTNKRTNGFDPQAFLANVGLGRAIVDLKKDQIVYSQGDEADGVFYVQHGKIKLNVVSAAGKEATVALLGAGDFLGEGCIVKNQPGNAGGDSGHNPRACELLYESLPQTGFHRIQRQDADPPIAFERGAA